MSQAGVNNSNIILNPTIPTQFTADDSTTAIPASNNLNVFARSSTDDNANGIQTTADPNASDNLYIELTNRATGFGISGNGATVTLITFPLASSAGVYRFTVNITGIVTAGSDAGSGVGYTIYASVNTDGATASIIASPYTDSDENLLLILDCSGSVDVSGNNFLVKATGKSGDTISYVALLEYILIQEP